MTMKRNAYSNRDFQCILSGESAIGPLVAQVAWVISLHENIHTYSMFQIWLLFFKQSENIRISKYLN